MVRSRVVRLERDLYLFQLLDEKTRFFESLWYIPEGVTYNAYVIDTGEEIVLIDGWKRSYGEALREYLEREFGLDRPIVHVVNHMEPDHSGSIPYIVSRARRYRVLGHPMARDMIQQFYGVSPEFRAVGDGERVVVGSVGLRFIYTPWLHWPETIVTLLEDRGVLFSCDVFGGYGVYEKIYADELSQSELEEYLRLVRKYMATVIGFYRRWVVKNIEKLRTLGPGPRAVMPGHGLLWRDTRVIDYYYRLGREERTSSKTVVLYSSMYGFVEEVVEYVREALRERGIEPVVYGFTDTSWPHLGDIVAEVYDAENIVVLFSTYETEPHPLVREVIELITRKTPSGKNFLVVSLYSWGGRAGKTIADMLREGGHRVELVEMRTGDRLVKRGLVLEALSRTLAGSVA